MVLSAAFDTAFQQRLGVSLTDWIKTKIENGSNKDAVNIYLRYVRPRLRRKTNANCRFLNSITPQLENEKLNSGYIEGSEIHEPQSGKGLQ